MLKCEIVIRALVNKQNISETKTLSPKYPTDGDLKKYKDYLLKTLKKEDPNLFTNYMVEVLTGPLTQQSKKVVADCIKGAQETFKNSIPLQLISEIFRYIEKTNSETTLEHISIRFKFTTLSGKKNELKGEFEIANFSCNTCHAISSTAQFIDTCSGCLKTNYCSKECQKKDWKQHKIECVKKDSNACASTQIEEIEVD